MCVCGCCLSVKARIVGWCRHYIYFSKAASCLLGLVLAHGLVENAVVDILMLYLTEDWKSPSLLKAAAIVNIEEAISGVIALIVAILTQLWVGHFKMVLYTTASFILGLVLLAVSTFLPSEMKGPFFYVALLLISFGKAGKDPPFKDFVRDQVRGNSEEQIEDRTTFWWRVFRLIGAAISVLFLSSMPWQESFMISAAVMGATYLIFIVGTYCPYNYTLPPGKYPFYTVLKVVKAAFNKRGLNYPCAPAGYYLNQQNELSIFPLDPFLRCIDKAAIVEQDSTSELKEENLCSVEQVRQAKSLLRLFPLWLLFSFYGLVTAAGNTFFIEQSSGLKEDIPVGSFFIMISFVSFIASYLANLLLSRCCSRNEIGKLKGALIKVGTGIGVSLICCEVAARVERSRLDLVDKHEDPDKSKDATLPMSILWLSPQFIMLGIMDGLSEGGLTELFHLFVHESMEGIETSINQLMLGFGKVLSVGCTFVFQGWFGKSINTSRLDKYFNMLMHLSLGNFLLCILIGYYYICIQRKETQFKSHGAPQEVSEHQELELIPALQPEQDEGEDEEEALVKKRSRSYKRHMMLNHAVLQLEEMPHHFVP